MEAIGTKQGITEKSGDWFEVSIGLPGKQYPLKLSTKKQELVELARAAGDNVMVWEYNEVDSGTPNPHRPGSNYINRYLEGVRPSNGPGSVATPGAAPQAETYTHDIPELAARARTYIPDTKDRMIVRQTALKAAAEIVAPRAGTSIDPDYDAALEVMRAAQRFETWVYRDIGDPPSSGLSEHDDNIPF